MTGATRARGALFFMASIVSAAGCHRASDTCVVDADCPSGDICDDSGLCAHLLGEGEGAAHAGEGEGGGEGEGEGEGSRVAVPASWTCDPAAYAGNDGCDCGCGAVDPDCAGASCTTPGCDAAACEFCYDAAGNIITCSAGLGQCETCSKNSDCASGNCEFFSNFPGIDWCTQSCSSDADCDSRMFCNGGACAPRTVDVCDGNTLVHQDNCGHTYGTTACGAGQACVADANGASCQNLLPDCSPCTADAQCQGGECGFFNDFPSTRWCTHPASQGCASPMASPTNGGSECIPATASTSCSASNTEVIVDECGNSYQTTNTCSNDPGACVIDADCPGQCEGDTFVCCPACLPNATSHFCGQRCCSLDTGICNP